MSIGERIRAERERLGHSQDQWASTADIHRNTQAKYERGEGAPDANYLAAIEEIGADIYYIVTGEKSVYVRAGEALARECAIISNVVEGLEIALESSGRTLSPQKKSRVVSMLFRLAYPSGIVEQRMLDEVIALAE